jgi:glycine oxidase
MYPGLVEEVQAQSGIDVEYKRPGMLRTVRTDRAAQAMREIADAQPGLEWVDASALRELEPALAHDVIGAVYSEGDADLNPGLWTNALAAAAERLGCELMRGTSVTGFEGTGGRITEVSTDNGDIHADAVVLAAGPWTEVLTMHLGTMVPTPPKRGQMIAYRSNVLRHAVWGEDGYLVPKLRGFVWAGATVEDAGFEKTNTPEALLEIETMAIALVPALAHADVASTWAGLRPGSPDGLPIIGAMPGKANVFLACGHFRNGILLAPVTGRLVADLILGGRLDERLAPFSAERFT